MYQFQKSSIEKLLETSQRLHGSLVASPVWELIKTEPVIMDWMNSLSDIESQIKKSKEMK